MAASYKKTTVKSFPKVGEKITRDSLYWKHLEFPVTKKEYAAVSHIEFSPVSPHNYAVTCSARVQIHNSRTHEAINSFSRFRELAYSGSFRYDGRLLVAGGDEGVVRLFDSNRKTLLRMFRGHSGAVHVTKFLKDKTRILSGSDDKTVKIWDIPSQSELCTFSDATDYVRCGLTSRASKDIVVTGCYDHKLRVYDIRSGTNVMTADHEQPIESVLMFPAGGVILSAGGNTIKVWDVLAGGRLITSLSHHHKTIMSMDFCSKYSRLVSASLDRHVKIYDVGTYEVVHTMDYPSAILSVAVSPKDKLIAVGMADGLLSVQRRRDSEDIEAEKLQKKRHPSFKYKTMMNNPVSTQENLMIEHKQKEKLEPYDKFLKSFKHTKALDAAMDIRLRVRKPEVTVSVLLELMRRDALRAALAGRDEKSLTAILKFLLKNLSNPKYTEVLVEVVNLVLDLYTEEIGQSTAIEQTLVLLKQTVEQEVKYRQQLMETLGAIDCLFAATQQESHDAPNEHFDISNIRELNIDSEKSEMEADLRSDASERMELS